MPGARDRPELDSYTAVSERRPLYLGVTDAIQRQRGAFLRLAPGAPIDAQADVLCGCIPDGDGSHQFRVGIEDSFGPYHLRTTLDQNDKNYQAAVTLLIDGTRAVKLPKGGAAAMKQFIGCDAHKKYSVFVADACKSF